MPDLSRDTCYIRQIPSMCSADSRTAVLRISKMRLTVRGYTQSASVLSAYLFDSADAIREWEPLVYSQTLSNDADPVVTEVSSDSCSECSDTSAAESLVFTWYSPAITAAEGRTWLDDLGGSCASSTPTTTDTGVSTPSTAKAMIVAAASAAAMTPAGGGGGSTPPEPSTCDVFVGVVTNAPAGGFGTGTVKRAVFNADGSYTTTGEDIPVVFPYI